jgi:two-component system, OmpR family, osmolarity sensor histidine kinase EnvZ
MKLHLDSLFVRLLAIQLIAVIAIFATFVLTLGQSRTAAAARVIAPQWAEAAHRALGTRPPAQATQAVHALTGALPTDATNARAAHFDVLREEIASYGITVDAIRTSRQRGQTSTWLEVKSADGKSAWVGFQGNVFGPQRTNWFGFIAIAALLTVLALSIGFTWMVVSPLRKLQGAMRAYRQHGRIPETMERHAVSGPRETRDLAQTFVDLAKQRARQDEERELMLASISHDLRTPLARIRLHAELMDDTDSSEVKQAITRNVSIADRHLASFLDFSAPFLADETTDINIAALWKALAAQTELAASDVNIAIAPEAAKVIGSRRVLTRLLATGLENAIKHGAPPIHLRTYRRSENVVFEIEDSGVGVPASERERVMRPFERGEQSRTTPGTGLGLALATQMAQRLGGHIALDQQARGLIYRLEVPIRRAERNP